jgi:hypothetical protein
MGRTTTRTASRRVFASRRGDNFLRNASRRSRPTTDEASFDKEIADETAASCAAEISAELQNYDSNQLIDAVYDDRSGAELALHL